MSSQSVSDPRAYRDKQEDWYAHFDGTRRQEIASLLTDEVIAEHEANPIGYRNFHSPQLQRVLNYMRTQPVLGKYFVYTRKAWQDYGIAVIQNRGEAPELLEGHSYASEVEAMHAVFLLRAQEIRDKVGESAR